MVRRFHWSRGGAVTFAVAMACTPLSVSAQNIVAPDVPGNIAVPEGHKLLTAGQVGREDGPTGGHRLTQAKYIQRLNTRGGTAPAGRCAASADLGRRVFVPYTADYFFYRRAPGKDATP